MNQVHGEKTFAGNVPFHSRKHNICGCFHYNLCFPSWSESLLSSANCESGLDGTLHWEARVGRVLPSHLEPSLCKFKTREGHPVQPPVRWSVLLLLGLPHTSTVPPGPAPLPWHRALRHLRSGLCSEKPSLPGATCATLMET